MLLGGLDDQDPNDWNDEECKNAGDLNVPVAILCSSDSEYEEDLPSMTTTTSSTGTVLGVPAATLCWSDESEEGDDGDDSEELDNADTGTSGECSTKRGAPVHQGGRESGKRKQNRIRKRGRMEVFDSNEMRWASCCGVLFCGCNARLCEVSALFSQKKFPARKKGGVTISSTELKIRGGGRY